MPLRANWMSALLLVTALSGCAHTLRSEDWNTAVPKGACTVHIVSPNAWVVVEHYTADGRLLSGRTPVDNGSGWFQHQYDAQGRRIEITEYEDLKHYSSPCEALGGCDTPPTRVIRRQSFIHDEAGRLIREEESRESYKLEDDKYRGSCPDRTQTRYTYDAEGRLVRTRSGGTTRRLEYSAGRLVRSDLKSNGNVMQLTAKYDSQGRLSETEELRCSAKTGQCYDTYPSARFRYDDAGRLIRKDLLYDKGDYTERSLLWEYDDRGLLTAFTRVQIYRRTGQSAGNTWKFTYDALGRLTASTVDGQPYQQLSYSGACERVFKPAWNIPVGPQHFSFGD